MCSKSISSILAVFFAALLGNIAAQPISPVDKSYVHEAFIQKTGGTILLDAIAYQPPEEIQERPPTNSDSRMIWIGGYWQWDQGRNDFVWVSGTLRKPPPGHQWIEGFWYPFEQGWVRLPGFWSPVSTEQIQYINQAPPDPINENIPNSPGEEYFWAQGYWEYSFENQQFYWIVGKWVPLDPNWIYVPAHYMWHPEGYIFVPPYWDWGVEERGSAYVTVFIEPDDRASIIYEPAVVIELPVLVEILFPYYPDYHCMFHHWYYYEPHFWTDYCCSPPWWHWNSWWGFTWHDQWALWWWYTHPGYPQPQWMSSEVSAMIPPPPPQLLSTVKPLVAPEIVTSKGVVAPNTLLKSISATTKLNTPILPANIKTKNAILQIASTALKPVSTTLKPTGTLQTAEKMQPSLPKTAVQALPSKNTIKPIEIPQKPSLKPISPLDLQKPSRPVLRQPVPPIRKPQDIQPQPPTPRPVPPIRRPQVEETDIQRPVRRPLPPALRPQTQDINIQRPGRRPIPPSRRPQIEEIDIQRPVRRPLPPALRPQTQDINIPQTPTPQTQIQVNPQTYPPQTRPIRPFIRRETPLRQQVREQLRLQQEQIQLQDQLIEQQQIREADEQREKSKFR